jgi:hypothetical protein
MMIQRLRGVLKQYGPEVTFLTGEIVVGSLHYLTIATGFDANGDFRCLDPSEGVPDGLQRLRLDYPGDTLRETVEARLELGLWPELRWKFPGDDPQTNGLVFLYGDGMRTSTDPRLLRGADEYRGPSPSGSLLDFLDPDLDPLIPWLARVVHLWLRDEPRVREHARKAPTLARELASDPLARPREGTALANGYWQDAEAAGPLDLGRAASMQLFHAQQIAERPYCKHTGFGIMVRYFDRLQSLDLMDVSDWFEATRPDLMSLSIESVQWRRRLWEARLSRRADRSILRGPRPTSEVVFERDGYRVEALVTGDALAYEGALQRHCVATYAGAVASGQTAIYAILGPDGVSRATVDVGPPDAPRVRQFKGWKNAPVYDTAVAAVLAAFCDARGIQHHADPVLSPPLTRAQIDELWPLRSPDVTVGPVFHLEPNE